MNVAKPGGYGGDEFCCYAKSDADTDWIAFIEYDAVYDYAESWLRDQ